MSFDGQTITTIIVAAAAAIACAVAGALFTKLDHWYFELRKPSWQPPDWLFGPAWTTIFTLTAASGAIAWLNADTRAAQITVIVLFAINGALNMAWSYIFFTRRRPDLALIEVGALWLSILVLILALWPLSALASLLLVPYLVWVTFAATLNATIVRLNPDAR